MKILATILLLLVSTTAAETGRERKDRVEAEQGVEFQKSPYLVSVRTRYRDTYMCFLAGGYLSSLRVL